MARMPQSSFLGKITRRIRLAILLLGIASLGLAGCSTKGLPVTPTLKLAEPASTPAESTALAKRTVEELDVQLIPLAELISNPKAQFSGMSLYGDWLILLPQYPSYFQKQGAGALVAISKPDMLAVVDGKSTRPLEPHFIALDDQGVIKEIRGFEGYECITFYQDTVYMSIEAQPRQMLGYLVKGTVQPDSSGLPETIRLDPTSLVEIQPQAALDNYSDETCLVYKDQVISLYEANGANVNPAPVAHVYDLNLGAQGTLAFPSIEYRITDATEPDAQGRFWAINYLYPGDTNKLQPLETDKLDSLAQQHGIGKTHAEYETVERLVQFQISREGIQRIDISPLQLALLDDQNSRNWEGIVELEGRGFLLVTDSFPDTLLGFVAYPR